jgi:hypothetical protein
MISSERIDSIIDQMIQRLSDNKASLGLNVDSQVIEGDEFPTYLNPPVIYVIPLVEGEDNITFHMGSDDASHEFPVSMAGYYKYFDVNTGIRPVRGWGYAAMDLFRGKNNMLDCGRAINPRLRVRYFRVTDYILHVWTVRYQIKTIA